MDGFCAIPRAQRDADGHDGAALQHPAEADLGDASLVHGGNLLQGRGCDRNRKQSVSLSDGPIKKVRS